jgi:cbb3-type cytochrome c oxidase subunit III
VSQLWGKRREGARLAAWLATLALAAGTTTALAGNRVRGSELRPDLIYHNYCSVCHGDRGDGRSRAQHSLNPPPANLTTEEMRKVLTRERMILALQHGRPGTAMTSWTKQLTQKEIEAVVDYVRDTMMAPEPGSPLATGKAVYAQYCAACHGERGQGVSVMGHGAPRPFGVAATEAERARQGAAVAEGRFGALDHAFGARLKTDEIAGVAEYVRKSLAPTLLGGVSGTVAHSGRERDAAKPATPERKR